MGHQHTMCGSDTTGLLRVPSWEGHAKRKADLRKPLPESSATLRASNITPPRSSCSSKLRANKPTPPRSPLQPLDASMEPSALRKRRGSVDASMGRPALRKRRGSAPVVLPTITGGKKRSASARARSAEAPKEKGGKVQIARKLFNVIHAVFKEHDADGNGVIDQEEFVRAVMRMESRDIVGRHGPEGQRKRPSTGETLEKHAVAMLDTLTRSRRIDGEGISLETFVGLYFPYLPTHEVKRACHHYTYKSPTPDKKEKTLDDVEGAREEIEAIFDHLDSDHDGLVRVQSLKPLLTNIGVEEDELNGWLRELPGAHLQRRKSRLGATDFENLLGPTYIEKVQSPKKLSKAELERQMEWNKEIYLEVVGGFANKQKQ